MNMKTKPRALLPTPKDPRDKPFHFHRVFGSVSSFDEGYKKQSFIQDQDNDSRPTACTAYTLTTIARNENSGEYSHDYQLMKTFEVMDVSPDSPGADARQASKIPVAFGLLPKSLEPGGMHLQSQAWSANQANWLLSLDQQTLKEPAYLPISPGFQDWFDAIRSALDIGRGENRTVGLASQWSPDFEHVGVDGILTENPQNLYWGHMYEAVWWCTIGNQPYLILNTWQGSHYGDQGYVYMSRKLCNRMMGTLGTYAVTLQKVPTGTVEELKQAKITYLQVILALVQNVYMKIRYGFY